MIVFIMVEPYPSCFLPTNPNNLSCFAIPTTAEYLKRQLEIQDAVRRQLIGYRIFAANIETENRIPERLEAAIMESLYKQPMPLCDIPDRGMFLAPRWKSEIPIVVKNKCQFILYGLPDCLEI